MLQAGKWGVPSVAKSNKATQNALNNEEIRGRILANARVLFPSSGSNEVYEIVYGSRPRASTSPSPNSFIRESTAKSEPPWQYAMIVRRNPSGDYTALIRGQAWSTTTPWSMVLQGLLDATAAAIHKKYGMAPTPPLGIVEELPRYSAAAS